MRTGTIWYPNGWMCAADLSYSAPLGGGIPGAHKHAKVRFELYVPYKKAVSAWESATVSSHVLTSKLSRTMLYAHMLDICSPTTTVVCLARTFFDGRGRGEGTLFQGGRQRLPST